MWGDGKPSSGNMEESLSWLLISGHHWQSYLMEGSLPKISFGSDGPMQAAPGYHPRWPT
jgi:hypothetical protein